MGEVPVAQGRRYNKLPDAREQWLAFFHCPDQFLEGINAGYLDSARYITGKGGNNTPGEMQNNQKYQNYFHYPSSFIFIYIFTTT